MRIYSSIAVVYSHLAGVHSQCFCCDLGKSSLGTLAVRRNAGV